jgi:hypothetical protein
VLLLHQPLSQPTIFLLAMMWIAGMPSDGMYYDKNALNNLPDMLHIPSVITHITPFRKGHLACWLYSHQVLYHFGGC